MPLLQHLAIPIILHFILVEVSLLFVLVYNFEKKFIFTRESEGMKCANHVYTVYVKSLIFFLSAAVSSYFSLATKVLRRIPNPSLGAVS